MILSRSAIALVATIQVLLGMNLRGSWAADVLGIALVTSALSAYCVAILQSAITAKICVAFNTFVVLFLAVSLATCSQADTGSVRVFGSTPLCSAGFGLWFWVKLRHTAPTEAGLSE